MIGWHQKIYRSPYQDHPTIQMFPSEKFHQFCSATCTWNRTEKDKIICYFPRKLNNTFVYFPIPVQTPPEKGQSFIQLVDNSDKLYGGSETLFINNHYSQQRLHCRSTIRPGRLREIIILQRLLWISRFFSSFFPVTLI